MKQNTLVPSLRNAGLSAVLGLFGISAFAQDIVPNSAAGAKPIRAGEKVPNATLKGQDGRDISLKKALGGKPTVIIFYRGGWCPFCNAHLSELARMEGDIRNKGYQVIAISPELPGETNKVAAKDQLNYKLYSDSSAEAMKKFGVAYRLDDPTFNKYRDKYQVNLEALSGQNHHILPVPSVYVVDKSGRITFSYSNPDYSVRLKGAEILKALQAK